MKEALKFTIGLIINFVKKHVLFNFYRFFGSLFIRHIQWNSIHWIVLPQMICRHSYTVHTYRLWQNYYNSILVKTFLFYLRCHLSINYYYILSYQLITFIPTNHTNCARARSSYLVDKNSWTIYMHNSTNFPLTYNNKNLFGIPPVIFVSFIFTAFSVALLSFSYL